MTRPGSRTSLPRVDIGIYEGPLDLLLDEVRRQNVEIEKIAMAPMVSRFLDYLRTAEERNFNLDIEWLHMAATLIHWKSQSLLPRGAEGRPEADPIRDQLVQQLLLHRRHAAAELGRRKASEDNRFSRRVEGSSEEAVEPDGAPDLSVWEMIQQARDLASWVERRRRERSQRQDFGVRPDDVTVAEMIEYLRAQLPGDRSEKLDGLTLLYEQPTSARRACLFLGMLEMLRNQELEVEQKELFGPLWLEPTVGPTNT